MPQFTEFPHLPPGQYHAGVDAFVRTFRRMPPEGESFKAFRTRLRQADLWNRERLPVLLRFMRLAHSDPMLPSALARRMADLDAEGARAALAERLWDINALLFSVVVTRLNDRVHSPNELFKYIDSFAYPGARISAPALRSWLYFAQGLGLFKPIGVRLGLDELAAGFAKRVKQFDIEEFLEEDQEEPPVEVPVAPVSEATAASAPDHVSATTTTAATPQPPTAAAPVQTPALTSSALDLGAPIAIRDFQAQASQPIFTSEVLALTTARLKIWADEATPSRTPGIDRFPIDGTEWNEDAPRLFFRICVAAAVLFRLGQTVDGAVGAFAQLDSAGALDGLLHGTVPTGPIAAVDPTALMLASVVARRCADQPDLALEVERCTDAKALFDLLSKALGAGLFSLELFWIMRALGQLGLVRLPNLLDFTTVPTREVRDVLFRLGYIDQPYAPNAETLQRAARAAAQALGGSADGALSAFAHAAGCGYSCPNRSGCALPCRERAEPGR